MKAELEEIETKELPIGTRELPSQGLRFPALARDIATMGSGTALAALFNTFLVFLIPRLISIEDFGYWRLFLLYTSYAGFLHLGFADGALLRWAGRPLEEFHHEIAPSMRFLVCEHLMVIVPGALLAAVLLPQHLRVIGVSVFLFALIANSVTLLQFSLQGAKVFGPVAVVTAAPTGIFLFLVFLWELRRTPNFRELIVLYFLAWTSVLVYVWIRVRPRQQSLGSAWQLGRGYVSLGWPILLANTSYSLVGAADRFAVSAALPIYDFALYGFAASTMFVPVAAIATVYRAFFSHLAGVGQEGRPKVYAHTSKFLLMLWSLSLPYYFVLATFVRHFLPKYVPALPLAGILLLGVMFLAGIQVLHMSYFYLHGGQRQFLLQSIVALAVSFSSAVAMALWLRSLAAVAVGQVVALGLWWSLNEWGLRKTAGQGSREYAQALALFCWCATALLISTKFSQATVSEAITYYALVVPYLVFSSPEEVRLIWKLVRQASLAKDEESPV